MTPTESGHDASPQPERLTLDDVRHKALAVRDTAKEEARAVVRDNRTQIIIASALVVALALSAAYYFGTRAARRDADPGLL